MASFYEPQQGANGLDMLVSNIQQDRKDSAQERIRQQKVQDANAKFNISLGQKLLGDKDVSGQPYSDLYNKEQSKAMDLLAQHANDPYPEYAMLANGQAQYLAGLQGKINNYLTKSQKGAETAKAIGADPTLYKNQLANRIFTHDGQNIKSIDDMDVDDAVKYLDNNKHLYYQNPAANVDAYFSTIEKVPGEYKDSDKKMIDGSRQSTQYNYTIKPGISRFNPKTGAIEMDYKPVTDDYGLPIEGRRMLGDQAWQVLQQSPATYGALEAYLKKVNPTIDPDSPTGKQFMRELAYSLAEPHKGFITKQITNDVAGDPYKPLLEQGRIQAQQMQQLLIELELQNKKEKEKNGGKGDPFLTNFAHVIGNDQNVVSGDKVQISNGDVFAPKFYSATPVGGTFPGGRVAVGLDNQKTIVDPAWLSKHPDATQEDLVKNQKDNPNYRKPIYAQDVLRTDNGGIIVKMPSGETKVYDTPQKIKQFITSIAPLNKSTAVKAAEVLGGDQTPKQNFIQKGLGKIFPKKPQPSPPDDFDQYKRKKKDPLGILDQGNIR